MAYMCKNGVGGPKVLKAQNLPGTLPKELVKFPYLQEIDLSRNFINGTIPAEWGSMQLVNISLLGNRLSGSIPKELGNITTLTSISAEFNQLSEALPQELGKLPKIQRMLLSSNNFTGDIPETFAKLTTLKDLRISDLNGSDATFPPLSSMQKMKILILRSCNLIGQLPEYLGDMTTLKTLDLSFNKLSGEIPTSFSGLVDVDYLYFTRNLLTGSVPSWILEKGDVVDLSYNNFTAGSQGTLTCQQRSVNLFASTSRGNTSGTVYCLRSFQCPKSWYSLLINCGGRQVTLGGNTTYEEDTDGSGPSRFFQSRSNWAFSSTGHFLDDDRPTDTYIGTNASKLSMNDSQLYMNARISPISLTYYGFCLGNGNYTVNLHFAEIMFTNDNTYSSLGRRIFDIYLQGKLVQKDFNIEDEAGGVGKAVIKKFPVAVTNSTLEIRFHWAGKGTTGIPVRGVYGPLISAISVNPDFIPPSENTGASSGISVGAVIGIVAGAAFGILLIVLTLKEQGSLLDLVDPRMGSDYNKEEVMAMINVALLCTNATAAARPAMSSVVSMLEGRAAVQELVTDSSNFSDESKSQAMKRLYQHLEEKSAPESQRHSSMSTVGPWTSSSTSAADLYPVTLTSDYWQNRDSSTT
ncbi:hypothetical protein SCA6_018211 [Theobroma cacao]